MHFQLDDVSFLVGIGFISQKIALVLCSSSMACFFGVTKISYVLKSRPKVGHWTVVPFRPGNVEKPRYSNTVGYITKINTKLPSSVELETRDE